MIFEILVVNILPLYGLILLGFLVGRFAKLEVEPIASLMIYGLIPVVMFGAAATMKLSQEYFIPPLIIASISIIASVTAYKLGQLCWPNDNRANLLAMLGVSSNATYFGVPIAVAIAGKDSLGIYMMMLLPLFILDGSLAVYFGIRGNFNVRESLIKTARLPIIYGAIAGLIFNLSGFVLSELLYTYWERFTGALIITGMMVIGAGLAKIEKTKFDPLFFSAVAAIRYLLWPILGLIFIASDIFYWQLFPEVVHTFIFLICVCPLAASNVAYAAQFGLHPVLTATMVMISTVLALGFIPLAFWLKSFLF